MTKPPVTLQVADVPRVSPVKMSIPALNSRVALSRRGCPLTISTSLPPRRRILNCTMGTATVSSASRPLHAHRLGTLSRTTNAVMPRLLRSNSRTQTRKTSVRLVSTASASTAALLRLNHQPRALLRRNRNLWNRHPFSRLLERRSHTLTPLPILLL